MREFKDLKIAVAGTGYVGLSIATLLSQHHKVTAVDIIPEKVELINNKKSPIQDEYIEKYLAEKELNLTATLDAKEAYSDADFVVIAAPTNYDSKKNFFDTSAVEAVIKLVIEYNPEAIMVIKSTIPVGIYNEYIDVCIGELGASFHPVVYLLTKDGVVEYVDVLHCLMFGKPSSSTPVQSMEIFLPSWRVNSTHPVSILNKQALASYFIIASSKFC